MTAGHCSCSLLFMYYMETADKKAVYTRERHEREGLTAEGTARESKAPPSCAASGICAVVRASEVATDQQWVSVRLMHRGAASARSNQICTSKYKHRQDASRRLDTTLEIPPPFTRPRGFPSDYSMSIASKSSHSISSSSLSTLGTLRP
jgi:hypothetical protein